MMEKINDGGPAFPCDEDNSRLAHGMTLRDKFADSVLPAVYSHYIDLVKNQECKPEQLEQWVSYDSYKMADAMLKAREVLS